MNQESHGVAEISRNLGRIEGKIDALVSQLQEHVKKDEAAWDRIGDLEKKFFYAAGMASAIVALFTTGVISILKKLWS